MQKNISNQFIIHKEKDGIEYIEFKALEAYSDKLIHCITTKIGCIGNSTVNHAEACEHTKEHFNLLCDTVGVDYRNLVFANQVHEDEVRIVKQEDRGEGILRPRKQEGSDALITVIPEIALVAFFADCVPILFYDPEKNIIATTHAGWRGTVKKIAAKTAKKMIKEFDCRGESIIACIGPSIGKCCFEVDMPVKEQFENAFGLNDKIIESPGTEKFKVDLWEANILQLHEVGLKSKNIHAANICTSCSNDIFYSYRADGNKTGRNYALMQLK